MSEPQTEPVRSYISPKLLVRKSPIHGKGIFAMDDIAAGEVVFIKGGHILRRENVWSRTVINSYLPLDDDFAIGAVCEEEEARIKIFVNHSCDPNCGIRGEITFVAVRAIAAGEEVTCDYAMIDNEAYEFTCKCGSASCRNVVTGFDWRRKDLQKKYGSMFARYLLDKIYGGIRTTGCHAEGAEQGD
jgi:hypothetical protein